MSKDTKKVTKLIDLSVNEVSIVGKGANKRNFLIMKDASVAEAEMPEQMKKGEEKMENKLVSLIKSLLSKPNLNDADIENIEKSLQSTEQQADVQKAVDEAIVKTNSEAQKKIDEANKATEEALKKAQELEEKVKKEQEESERIAKEAKEKEEESAILKKAEEELTNISIEKAEFANKMRVLKSLSTELYEYVYSTVKAANEQISKGELFKEAGHSNPENLEAKDQLEKIAKDIQAKENVSIQKARVLASERNPELTNKLIYKKQ